MSDHLNSMHLEPSRREQFRHARAAMLEGCGDFTRMGGPLGAEAGSRTLLENLVSRLPAEWDFGLMDRGVVHPLKVGLNTIGRMPDNEVVIDDPYISRRHCAIVVHGDKDVELHDIASKNGTYLNGARLTGPTPLTSGDEIRMCERQLIFVSRPEFRNLSYPSSRAR